MGRFLLYVLAVIGFLSLVAVAGAGWLAYDFIASDDAEEAPDRMVLVVDLREDPPEGPPATPLLEALGPQQPTVREITEAIDRARDDDRVGALVAILGGDTFGPAKAQDIRDAVIRFRESGKPALAHSTSLGELGPGTIAHYVAASFDEIWLQPGGFVGLTGIHVEIPFAADALDDFGIEPDLLRSGRFKSFPEIFTETGFSPANREMTESLVGDLFDQIVAGIAEGRGLAPAEVERLIDTGPHTAQAALDAGLIDGLITAADFSGMVEERTSRFAVTVEPSDYLAFEVEDEIVPAGRVALIHAVGTIQQGRSVDGTLMGVLMGADTVAGAIEQAIEDPGIDAILLRIDSGGGSAIGSATIGEAVRNAVAQGKPVIASMAGAAASGGYWIAAETSEIVAQPGTLTGSIGVFGGKFVLEGLWRDLGVNWQGVQRGRMADIWTFNRPYSPAQEAQLTVLIDDIYQRFITLVARGRGLSPAQVDAIAQGRVWTGAQALELGLVDRLGGLDAALAAARERLALAPDAPLDIVQLPEPPSPFAEALDLLSGVRTGDSAALAVLDRLGPLAGAAGPLADPATTVLRMPEIQFSR
ncbi:MAG: signal peptide peptidase SppA [Inquilinaceae bacterium]